MVVTGTPPVGADVSATASATVTLTSSPALTVLKAADPSPANVGQTITYTYRLTNSGDVTLTGILAVDDALGAVPLAVTTLAPDEWTSGTLTYTVVEADLPGPLVNSVTVTGTPPVGADVIASDDASVTLVETEYRVWLPIVFKNFQP